MQTTEYCLPQENSLHRLQKSFYVSIAISAAGGAFIMYLALTKAYFPWLTAVMLTIWSMASSVYAHRKLVKQVKLTKLEITDKDITLTIPSRRTLNLNFADIRLVNKTNHGLVLVPVSNAQKVIMITNKFEDFGEIEAAIDRSVSPELIKVMRY
ncbi:hypothetical protein ACFGVR_04575 [Mucilaginibacter sp. AW1-3]